MQKKVYSVKSVKKTKNILEEHLIAKYGNINNFLESCKISDKEKIESAIKKANFLGKMRIGIKICNGLRIDFNELFYNGNISSAGSLHEKGTAEEKYSLLNVAARRKTMEYMNDILED